MSVNKRRLPMVLWSMAEVGGGGGGGGQGVVNMSLLPFSPCLNKRQKVRLLPPGSVKKEWCISRPLFLRRTWALPPLVPLAHCPRGSWRVTCFGVKRTGGWQSALQRSVSTSVIALSHQWETTVAPRRWCRDIKAIHLELWAGEGELCPHALMHQSCAHSTGISVVLWWLPPGIYRFDVCTQPHVQILHWEFVLRRHSEERDSNSGPSTQLPHLFIWFFFLFIYASNIPGLFWCLKPWPRLLVCSPPSVCVHISNYVSQMCVRVAAGAVHFLGGLLMQVTWYYFADLDILTSGSHLIFAKGLLKLKLAIAADNCLWRA